MSYDNTFDIRSNSVETVEKVCSETKTFFKNREQFVSEAVGYFILLWTNPEKLEKTFHKFLPHLKTDSLNVIKDMMGPDEYERILNEVAELYKSKTFEDIDLSQMEYEPSNEVQFNYTLVDEDLEAFNKILEDPTVKKKYGNAEGFLHESISFFISLWEKPDKLFKKSCALIDYIPEKTKKHWEVNYPESYKKFMGMKEHFEAGEADDMDGDSTSSLSVDKKIVQELDGFTQLCSKLKNTKEKIKLLPEEKFEEPGHALKKTNSALIIQFCTRFFPVKLAVSVLADMIIENNKTTISYDSYWKRVYNVAIALSEKLRSYEKENKTKRFQKFSTGLPLPPDAENDIKSVKVVASQKRFLLHFIGIKEKTWIKKSKIEELSNFYGALNSLGLAYFVAEDDGKPITEWNEKNISKSKIRIGLTERGKEFFLKDNPILDDYEKLRDSDNWHKPLSKDESDYIMKYVIPNFPLEYRLVKQAKKTIEEQVEKKCNECEEVVAGCSHILEEDLEKVISDWLRDYNKSVKEQGNSKYDDIPNDFLKKGGMSTKAAVALVGDGTGSIFTVVEKSTSLVPWRTALLGRLSELDVITWRIATKKTEHTKEGISYYTIPE